MPQFIVDEDLAALVEKLAKPRPFENLSFSDALRRVLSGHARHTTPNLTTKDLDALLEESLAAQKKLPKRAVSPSASEWVAVVPELNSKSGLTTWAAVCDVLKIETGGDSARRKLRNWVRRNRPNWPAVPLT